jgi:hypothetical protein
MERKIERGDWQEGKVWRRAPDGRIVIDVVGYQRWVEGQSPTVTPFIKAQPPTQMNLTLIRAKEIKSNEKAS